MVQVVYQLFNSFDFNKEFAPLFSQIKSEQTEEKMQISLWFRINKWEFDELKSSIYDNQNNKDFKITISKKSYDLKNAKIFWTKVTTSKISRNEVKKLYNELIQKDIDPLKREKINNIKKHNILEILENIDAIFTDTYLHYKKVPKKTIVERNISEKVKLRRGRIAEIEEEEKNIDNKLFKEYCTNYWNPSDMYEKLHMTEGEKNEYQVYIIKKVLDKMKKIIKNVPKDKTFKTEENKKIINIVERIFYLNQLDQSGKGLKILTADQMLSRLPITLAQLKPRNNLKNLKMKLDNYYILCTDKRNLQNSYIKVWSTLFKNGNNLYEHWK